MNTCELISRWLSGNESYKQWLDRLRAENRETEHQREEQRQANAESAYDRAVRHRMDDYYQVDAPDASEEE